MPEHAITYHEPISADHAEAIEQEIEEKGQTAVVRLPEETFSLGGKPVCLPVRYGAYLGGKWLRSEDTREAAEALIRAQEAWG